MRGYGNGKRYSPTERQAGALLATQIGQAAAAARIGATPETVASWSKRYYPDSDSSLAHLPAIEQPPNPLESDAPQTQPVLSPSDIATIPQKSAKVDLLARVVDAYALKTLALVDSQMSAVQAATVMGISIQRLQEMVEGRYRPGPQTTEQHYHAGPEYHQASARNAARHPKRKR